jgi:hypothetical protein
MILRPRSKPLWSFFIPVACLTLLAAGCGGGGGGAAGGTGGGAPGGSGGSASVQLAFSQFAGGVYDKASPANAWTTKMTSGDCRLIAPPSVTCNPPCSAAGTECVGLNQCAAAPVLHDAGTVTITGLKSAFTAAPLTNLTYFKSPAEFPPAAPGAVLTLTSTGGDYAAFTLKGQGIDPLVYPAPTTAVKDNQPLPFTWTPPTAGNATRIVAELDFSHHGGTPAMVRCDLADTGSAAIPGTLVHALLANGTSGFPTLTLTRRTADSTTIAAGCIDFSTVAAIEQPVTIDGVISCNCNSTSECADQNPALPCPSGHNCRTKGTVGGLTCD